jgi:cytochrome c-type biogenesis protein
MSSNTSVLDREPGAHAAKASRSWLNRHQGLLASLSVIVALLIASVWLVFPYFVRDRNLIGDVGGAVKQEKLNNAISIGKFLNRTTFGSGEAQVDVLFATPKFFEITDRSRAVAQYRPDRYLVFLVTETTHVEDLPASLPEAILSVDGRTYAPFDVEGPLEVYHHRVVSVRFPAYLDDGTAVLDEGARDLELTLHNSWDPDNAPRVVNWELPLAYPESLVNPSPWSPLMVLGLSAGLLSFVLTPCLLQLLVVYMVTLSGFSAAPAAEQLHGATRLAPELRRRIVLIAASFVAGLTALFTVTGAAMGIAGKQMQMFFAQWSPVLSVLAGIVVIVMGIWVGVRSRAPLVCRLVPPKVVETASGQSSYLGSAMVAVGFSLGCMTCFGGAIIATLLIYVGSIGSGLVGASIMFGFSMGVAVPFMLAALFLSRTVPLMDRVHRYSPYIGFASMLVIIAFGVVLLTDNFHALSDAIYPWLGL